MHFIVIVALEAHQLPIPQLHRRGAKAAAPLGFVKVGICPYEWSVQLKTDGGMTRYYVRLPTPSMVPPAVRVVMAVNRDYELLIWVSVRSPRYIYLVSFRVTGRAEHEGTGWMYQLT